LVSETQKGVNPGVRQSKVITVSLLNRAAILTFVLVLSKPPTQPLTPLRPLLGSRLVSMEFTEGI